MRGKMKKTIFSILAASTMFSCADAELVGSGNINLWESNDHSTNDTLYSIEIERAFINMVCESEEDCPTYPLSDQEVCYETICENNLCRYNVFSFEEQLCDNIPKQRDRPRRTMPPEVARAFAIAIESLRSLTGRD